LRQQEKPHCTGARRRPSNIPGTPTARNAPTVPASSAAAESARFAALLGGAGGRNRDRWLYSVISYSVARQTRELSVRIALGAGRAEIAGSVLGRRLAGVAALLLVLTALGCLVPVRRALAVDSLTALRSE